MNLQTVTFPCLHPHNYNKTHLCIDVQESKLSTPTQPITPKLPLNLFPHQGHIVLLINPSLSLIFHHQHRESLENALWCANLPVLQSPSSQLCSTITYRKTDQSELIHVGTYMRYHNCIITLCPTLRKTFIERQDEKLTIRNEEIEFEDKLCAFSMHNNLFYMWKESIYRQWKYLLLANRQNKQTPIKSYPTNQLKIIKFQQSPTIRKQISYSEEAPTVRKNIVKRLHYEEENQPLSMSLQPLLSKFTCVFNLKIADVQQRTLRIHKLNYESELVHTQPILSSPTNIAYHDGVILNCSQSQYLYQHGQTIINHKLLFPALDFANEGGLFYYINHKTVCRKDLREKKSSYISRYRSNPEFRLCALYQNNLVVGSDVVRLFDVRYSRKPLNKINLKEQSQSIDINHQNILVNNVLIPYHNNQHHSLFERISRHDDRKPIRSLEPFLHAQCVQFMDNQVIGLRNNGEIVATHDDEAEVVRWEKGVDHITKNQGFIIYRKHSVYYQH